MKLTNFLWISFCLLGLNITTQAQSSTLSKDTSQTNPQIIFIEKEYNFGTVQQGTKIFYNFKFKNIGALPLKIINVQTSCGCTVTEWTKEAIFKDGEGEIMVVFDTTGKTGQQRKTVLVISNASNREEKIALVGIVKE